MQKSEYVYHPKEETESLLLYFFRCCRYYRR